MSTIWCGIITSIGVIHVERGKMSYRIEEARLAKGWSQQQLAEMAGTTQQAIQRYENGQREPKISIAVRIADALGVSLSYLLGLDNVVEIRPVETTPVPVLGRIAAGTPREAFMLSDRFHDTPTTLVRGRTKAFWLMVAGNSMNRVFPEGSLVLIDPNMEVKNGDIGVVFVNGDDATIKRIYFEGDAIRLHPESFDMDYQDRVIDKSDPDAPEVCMVGKAISYTAPDGWRA